MHPVVVDVLDCTGWHVYTGVVGRMTEPGAGDVPEGASEHAGGPVLAESPVVGKSVVLLETYDGKKSWDEWYFCFKNVAAVNGWDDALKLKWLRVRLTGHAQKALQCIPESLTTLNR